MDCFYKLKIQKDSISRCTDLYLVLFCLLCFFKQFMDFACSCPTPVIHIFHPQGFLYLKLTLTFFVSLLVSFVFLYIIFVQDSHLREMSIFPVLHQNTSYRISVFDAVTLINQIVINWLRLYLATCILRLDITWVNITDRLSRIHSVGSSSFVYIFLIVFREISEHVLASLNVLIMQWTSRKWIATCTKIWQYILSWTSVHFWCHVCNNWKYKTSLGRVLSYNCGKVLSGLESCLLIHT